MPRMERRTVTGSEPPLRLGAALGAEGIATEDAATMEDAVRQAGRRARIGDVVLLSPACASFDMFQNYEHRGEVFKDVVRRLVPAGPR